MAVKAKRLVMDGTDVLEDNSEALKAASAARDAELRAIADEQIVADRIRLVETLDRIGKGLTGWRASRDAARPWQWQDAVESGPEGWRGLQRLGLLFVEMDALRDRISSLEIFHKPLWCPGCNPEQPFPGNPWTKWDCIDHAGWVVAHALNTGRDLFSFIPESESTSTAG